MQKTVDYKFDKYNDELKNNQVYDWGGNIINRNICANFSVGDIVRLSVIFNDGSWYGPYVEITKIDYYKKGKHKKPRKFHGKIVKIYEIYSDIKFKELDEGYELTFRKEDIYEIPNWKSEENYLFQHNAETIVNDMATRAKIKYKKSYNYNEQYSIQKRKYHKLRKKIKRLKKNNVMCEDIKKLEEEFNELEKELLKLRKTVDNAEDEYRYYRKFL